MPVASAERDAERIRGDTWGTRFPVDPVQIARQLGMDVLDAPLSPSVSGALVKEPGQDPTILLNAIDSPNRQRFTCAHEIGHFVKRFNEDADDYEYVDLRGPLAGAGLDAEEIYANAFAASLLMPEAEVRKLHREGRTALEMALYFDVSQEAMLYRLKNLGLSP
jgi:hypothetical protein